MTQSAIEAVIEDQLKILDEGQSFQNEYRSSLQGEKFKDPHASGSDPKDYRKRAGKGCEKIHGNSKECNPRNGKHNDGHGEVESRSPSSENELDTHENDEKKNQENVDYTEGVQEMKEEDHDSFEADERILKEIKEG
ncbi:hypothetical protein COOONC_00700 [Cooperia oncophora]